MSKKTVKTLLALAIATFGGSAAACGSEPYIGEVCTFANTYCPQGYVDTDGRVLPISQYQALFALVGTTYGGDGRSNFAVPDLRGRNPIGIGAGPGLALVDLGEVSGQEQVVLLSTQMPQHNHAATTIVKVDATLHAVTGAGNTSNPSGKVLATSSNRDNVYSSSTANTIMAPEAITTTTTQAETTVGITGGNQPFSVRNPYVGLRYCIATTGLFPQRP